MGLTYRINTSVRVCEGFRRAFGSVPRPAQNLYARRFAHVSPVRLAFPGEPASLPLSLPLLLPALAGAFGPVEKTHGAVSNPTFLVILSMVQTHMVTLYALAAREFKLENTGHQRRLGPAHQPKGRYAPALNASVVQNDIVRDELVRLPPYRATRNNTTGWLQMDCLRRGDRKSARDDVLQRPQHTRRDTATSCSRPTRPGWASTNPWCSNSWRCTGPGDTFGAAYDPRLPLPPQDRDWHTRWGFALGNGTGGLSSPPDLGPT